MSSSEQPVRYPRWATDPLAPRDEPSEGAKDLGWAAEQEADEASFNWLAHATYEWLVHLDERSVGPELLGRDAATWVEPTLGYTGAANTATLSATPGVVWVDGRRLDLSATYLESIGEDEHTFTIPSTTYVGINDARELTFVETTIGDPVPTPSAGVTLIMAVTVTVADPPAVSYLVPTGPVLAGSVSVEGPHVSTGNISAVDWGVGASVSVASRSQANAGTVSVDNSSSAGITGTTPSITITFPRRFASAPHAIVARNGGDGTGADAFSWTVSATALTIAFAGATLGGKGVYRFAWMVLGAV